MLAFCSRKALERISQISHDNNHDDLHEYDEDNDDNDYDDDNGDLHEEDEYGDDNEEEMVGVLGEACQTLL